ncbi:MAG: phosphoribosylaminoimidazolesuccinocarboxamide synthase [Bilophila wadsworthia]
MVDGELILIDEVLTPDSSRFWPAEGYKQARASRLRQAVPPRLAVRTAVDKTRRRPPCQGGGRSHPEQISRSLPHSDRLRACSLI